MKHIILLLAILVSFSSCQKEDNDPSNFSSVFGITDFQLAKTSIGEYSIFGVNPNGGVTIRTSSINSSGELLHTTSAFATFKPDNNRPSERTDTGDFYLNGDKWEYIDGQYVNSNLVQSNYQNYILNLFGKDLSFALKRNDEVVIEENIKAPMYLSNLAVEGTEKIDENSNVEWLDGDRDLLLEWNQDLTNKKGVLLVLTSQRDRVDEITSGHKETYVKVLFIENDDGEQIINKAFFSDLASKEMLTLTLYRGGFAYVASDGLGNDFKFYALSDFSAQFALR